MASMELVEIDDCINVKLDGRNFAIEDGGLG